MIPLKDNIRTRRPPFVNYGLIAITTIVFLIQVSRPEEPLVEQLGMIPARVLDPDASISIPEIRVHPFFGAREFQRPAAESMVPAWLTLLTCVFLHGGWLHFLGNMWFLHIFGDNVEDRFGHVGFFIFYLAAGVAASATHLLTNSGSEVPTIGASGAIAGVMGAYLVLFPHALVLTLIDLLLLRYHRAPCDLLPRGLVPPPVLPGHDGDPRCRRERSGLVGAHRRFRRRSRGRPRAPRDPHRRHPKPGSDHELAPAGAPPPVAGLSISPFPALRERLSLTEVQHRDKLVPSARERRSEGGPT